MRMRIPSNYLATNVDTRKSAIYSYSVFCICNRTHVRNVYEQTAQSMCIVHFLSLFVSPFPLVYVHVCVCMFWVFV